jgi:hypothetical protein
MGPETKKRKTMHEQWDDAINHGEYQYLYKYITSTNAEDQAKVILENWEKFKSIPHLSNRISYYVQKHEKYQTPPEDYKGENWIAKTMVYCSNNCSYNAQCKFIDYEGIHSQLGKLIDYEVPLKTPKTDYKDPESSELCDKGKRLGDIDILGLKEDKTAMLLELKNFTNKEHPLRAFLEVYTYWKSLGGDHAESFLNRHSLLKGATKLDKAVILYEESRCYKKLHSADNKVKECIKNMGVKCFVVDRREETDDKYLHFTNVREFNLSEWKIEDNKSK